MRITSPWAAFIDNSFVRFIYHHVTASAGLQDHPKKVAGHSEDDNKSAMALSGPRLTAGSLLFERLLDTQAR